MEPATTRRQIDLFRFLFPPRCLHCDELLSENVPLCPTCLEEAALLSKEGRCEKCTAEIPWAKGTCQPCRFRYHPYKKIGGCFEPFSPLRSLQNAFLSQRHFMIARDLASFLVLQCTRLSFPLPDLITAIPRHLQNPHYLIAKEVARLLDRPFYPLLRRTFSLTPTFALKKQWTIINQSVLVLGLHFEQIEEMHSVGLTLEEGAPETLYGMMLCTS